MPKQPAFTGLRDAMKKKVTRRELFLAEMEAVVPWGRLLALIPPHYPSHRIWRGVFQRPVYRLQQPIAVKGFHEKIDRPCVWGRDSRAHNQRLPAPVSQLLELVERQVHNFAHLRARQTRSDMAFCVCCRPLSLFETVNP